MNKLSRVVACVTLAAFLGLSAVESSHHHSAHQTTSNCAVCQIAHRTPALINSGSTIGPKQASASAPIAAPAQAYVQFVFVAHGLSPPLL